MPSSSTKADRVREQVIAKIHWGASDDEVLEWLLDRHQISGTDADRLIATAHAAKRRAVRSKAMLRLAFSGLGILVPIAFFGIQITQGILVIGYGSFLMGVLGVSCLAMFVRSFARLATGRVDGSIEL